MTSSEVKRNFPYVGLFDVPLRRSFMNMWVPLDGVESGIHRLGLAHCFGISFCDEKTITYRTKTKTMVVDPMVARNCVSNEIWLLQIGCTFAPSTKGYHAGAISPITQGRVALRVCQLSKGQ